MTPQALSRIKAALLLLCMLPLARLLVLGFSDRLGANPVEFVTRSTGTWSLVMLCLTLAVTPLRLLSGQPWLLRLRRMLGLFAFFYLCLHLFTWVWFDHWFEVQALFRDVFKRPFILVGMTAFLLMLPLALTSNNASMRRLGRQWSRLHRLVYAIAALAILHFWWMRAGKNNLGEPMLYAALMVGLLLARLPQWWRQARGRTDSSASRAS